MLIVSPVNEDKCMGVDENTVHNGFEKLKVKRSEVPAITHVDYSARVQTVKEADNPPYYALLKHFSENYGCPLVINTSFNVRGEPIVCTPDDAYRCFMRTNMDYLVMGSFLINKENQDPARVKLDEINEFELD